MEEGIVSNAYYKNKKHCVLCYPFFCCAYLFLYQTPGAQTVFFDGHNIAQRFSAGLHCRTAAACREISVPLSFCKHVCKPHFNKRGQNYKRLPANRAPQPSPTLYRHALVSLMVSEFSPCNIFVGSHNDIVYVSIDFLITKIRRYFIAVFPLTLSLCIGVAAFPIKSVFWPNICSYYPVCYNRMVLCKKASRKCLRCFYSAGNNAQVLSRAFHDIFPCYQKMESIPIFSYRLGYYYRSYLYCYKK